MPFGRYRTVNILSRLLFALVKSRLKARLSVSLCVRRKRWPIVALLFVDLSDRVRTHQGVSFARPLARRRFNTRRPAFVAIRALNPCVRARLILLG